MNKYSSWPRYAITSSNINMHWGILRQWWLLRAETVTAQNGSVSKQEGRKCTGGHRSSLRPSTLEFLWDKTQGGHTLSQTPSSYMIIYRIFLKWENNKGRLVLQMFSQNVEQENFFTSTSLKYAGNSLWSTKTEHLSRIKDFNCVKPVTLINW